MKTINVDTLIPVNAFEEDYPVRVDVVYAKPDHPDNHFPDLYHPEAKLMWVQEDLAAVTLLAAKICHALYGWTLKINDSLRPVEAQEKMAEYGYHPDLVSVPGTGAHPRAMAIDLEPLDETGKPVPMGTTFDHFVDDPVNDDNPAARDFVKFEGSVAEKAQFWQNRQRLEFAMRCAATKTGQIIWPLPQEWWDFRFESALSDQYAPLYEADLRPYQRLIAPDVGAVEAIAEGRFPPAVSDAIARLKRRVEPLL